ncbi:hypothetical protein [Isoptericola halotolerans]|uniref:Uncharacterized protein n=1 Tax=Isoptericola halotolerans TaxID=300560 RepID=A0ABX2A1A9_9MICO|nr:hypothetical protein [Isoptericola halotolerans]NOV96459.1 hypothetical protein [Isoptericola halotolerans]
MNLTTTPFRPGDKVADDGERLALATFLAGGVLPRERILTLAWLDADDRVTGIAVPVREVPQHPSDDDAARFGGVIASVTQQSVPGGSVVAILERPGEQSVTAADRAWNTALRAQAAQRDFRLHGLFVAAGGAVRPIAMDDAG